MSLRAYKFTLPWKPLRSSLELPCVVLSHQDALGLFCAPLRRRSFPCSMPSTLAVILTPQALSNLTAPNTPTLQVRWQKWMVYYYYSSARFLRQFTLLAGGYSIRSVHVPYLDSHSRDPTPQASAPRALSFPLYTLSFFLRFFRTHPAPLYLSTHPLPPPTGIPYLGSPTGHPLGFGVEVLGAMSVKTYRAGSGRGVCGCACHCLGGLDGRCGWFGGAEAKRSGT
ncbi:hypothetical protein R3P38DRAFT_1653820 [Favolaschia claudopus]|uniref:Uncharacterized protein n=1 Tax=Favolaschia claudopus TaxID=2862362 RepID=A0AAW0DNV3_9AGAR